MSINRTEHESWLLHVTGLPTAAGREQRVIDWVSHWVESRADLRLRTDDAGNLVIERDTPDSSRAPLFITAHLDHPAFVVEAPADSEGKLSLSFRGGVRDPYFVDAPIVLYTADDQPVRATIIDAPKHEPWRLATAKISAQDTTVGGLLAIGDVGRWDLPDPEVMNGVLHTHACDDLAALVAALAAMDELRQEDNAAHVKLLLTRAEEVGFVGAIAACKLKTMELNSRVLALENSRSFAESPLGGGPIVRVGDRMSTFSPSLTASVAKLADDIATRRKDDGGFRWQRKLMPGGVCEASTFMSYGYEATCICLPLGNYHNMADLSLVETEDPDAVANARAGREFIALADFHGLVDLLIEAGLKLDDAPPIVERMEKLYAERKHVLG